MEDKPAGSRKKKRKSAAEEPKKKKPKEKPRVDYSSESSEESGYASMDEAACKELMRPCKKQLKKLREGTDHLPRDEKVSTLKYCLSAVGARIGYLLEHDFRDNTQEEKDRWYRHLWAFSSYFWPKKVKPEKLQSIYDKLVGNGSQPAPSSGKSVDKGAPSAPRPTKRKASPNGASADVPSAKRRSTLSNENKDAANGYHN